MTFNITETGKFVQKVVFQLEKDYKMVLHPTAEKSWSQSLRVSLMWLFFYFLTSNIGIFFFENSVLDYLFWTQQSLPRCVMSQYISTMVLSVQGKPDPGSDES